MRNAITNPKVDDFFIRTPNWRAEFEALRRIILDCGLTEELKWGVPCYTLEGKNILLIHGFKEYCAILFVKGALIGDAERLLVRQTENVQAARQIRFTGVQAIAAMEAALKDYINEAIAVEKSGLKVDLKSSAAFSVPEELQAEFTEVEGLKAAFEALTPGRQRAYLLYFSAPKQSKTRSARVKKYVAHILNGKGLDD